MLARMTFLQALLLGIVQGLTEFLPVSSSTHLAIAKKILGLETSEALIHFDLICHLGTLAALFLVFWKDILRILTEMRSIALFFLALLPLIPAYFLLKPLRAHLASDAGFFLLATAAFLFLASSKRLTAEKVPSKAKWKDVLCIGVAQSLALFPGMSRSGSTIAAARLLGWQWQDAVRFSFLLAIPTILGGTALETLRGSGSIAFGLSAVGFTASFAAGLGSLRFLLWILEKGSLRPFAWYCLAAGLVALLVLK